MKKHKIALDSNLKELLKSEDLSLHKLSQKAEINKSSIHNYINGVVPQGLNVLITLSEFFNISLEELIFERSSLVGSKQNSKREDDESEGNSKEEKYEIIIKKI